MSSTEKKASRKNLLRKKKNILSYKYQYFFERKVPSVWYFLLLKMSNNSSLIFITYGLTSPLFCWSFSSKRLKNWLTWLTKFLKLIELFVSFLNVIQYSSSNSSLIDIHEILVSSKVSSGSYRVLMQILWHDYQVFLTLKSVKRGRQIYINTR